MNAEKEDKLLNQNKFKIIFKNINRYLKSKLLKKNYLSFILKKLYLEIFFLLKKNELGTYLVYLLKIKNFKNYFENKF